MDQPARHALLLTCLTLIALLPVMAQGTSVPFVNLSLVTLCGCTELGAYEVACDISDSLPEAACEQPTPMMGARAFPGCEPPTDLPARCLLSLVTPRTPGAYALPNPRASACRTAAFRWNTYNSRRMSPSAKPFLVACTREPVQRVILPPSNGRSRCGTHRSPMSIPIHCDFR
jgi:hypothetical protein